MLGEAHQANCGELGVGVELGQVHHHCGRYRVLIAIGNPLGRGSTLRELAQNPVQRIDVRDPSVVIGEARIIGELGLAGELEKRPELRVGVGQQTYPAVRSRIRAPMRCEQPVISEWPFGRLEHGAAIVLDEVERHHRLEHGHFDGLSHAGPHGETEQRGPLRRCAARSPCRQ